MADRTVEVVLTAYTAGYQAAMKQAADATDDVTKKAKAHDDALSKLGSTAALAGAAIGAGIAIAVDSAADFNEAMSAVAATGDDAKSNLDGLRQTAIDLGAATKYSATEAAQGTEAMAKAGMSAADIMGGGLAAAMNLAASGNMSVAESADFMATAMNNFNVPGAEAATVADAIAAGANKAQGDVSDMALAFSYVGIPARDAGMSVQQTAGAVAELASQGIIGEKAGTSLRGVLMSLEAPSTAAQKAMGKLGITLYDDQGKWLGYNNAVQQLHDKLGPLSDAERDMALGTIFGNEQIGAARVLMQGGAADANKWTEAVSQSGYAQQVASEKMNNLKGDIEQLKGSIETGLITAAQSTDGPLRGMTQNLTGVVNALAGMDAHSQGAVMAFGAIGAGALLVGGGVAKAVPAIREMKAAWDDLDLGNSKIAKGWDSLNEKHPKLTTGLGVLGKAAGAAAAVFAAFQVAGIVQDLATAKTSADDTSVALERLGSGSVADINKMFAANHEGAKTFGDAMLSVATGTGTARGSIQEFVANTTGFKGDMMQDAATIKQVDDALAKMDGNKAASAFDQISAKAKELNLNGTQLAAMFPQYAAKLQEVARAHGQTMTAAEAMDAALKGTLSTTGMTTAAADKLGGELGVTGGAVMAMSDKTQQLAQKQADLNKKTDDAAKAFVNESNAAIGLSGAQMNLEGSIAKADQALKDNKHTLDIHSETGRANRAALDGIASSAIALAKSEYDNGTATEEAEAKMKHAREEFIRVAEQMGMDSKEAENLADKYGLIPGEVPTHVSAPGAKEAIDEAQRLKAAIDNLHDKAINITAHYTSTGEVNFSDGAKARFASGGLLSGPGTGTSDSIPMWGSDGEYMQQRSAVDYYGVGIMDALNSRQIPREAFSPLRHATGGLVAPPVHYSNAPRYAPGGYVGRQQEQESRSNALPQNATFNLFDEGGILLGTFKGMMADQNAAQLRAARAY